MACLWPCVLAYKQGWVSGTTVRRKIVRLGMRRLPEAQVRARGAQFAAEVIPGLLRAVALERIAWHKQRGDQVVVVSASLDLYLAPWCRANDLQLICSELEVKNGRFTGRYHGADCTGNEKTRRIMRSVPLASFNEIYAYGDTDEDTAMLGLAHRKFFRWEELP